MEDTAAANIFSETLDDQFAIVKAKTVGSPVQKFGDFNFVSEYLGAWGGASATPTFLERTVETLKSYKSLAFSR
jgi:hypothetical protein